MRSEVVVHPVQVPQPGLSPISISFSFLHSVLPSLYSPVSSPAAHLLLGTLSLIVRAFLSFAPNSLLYQTSWFLPKGNRYFITSTTFSQLGFLSLFSPYSILFLLLTSPLFTCISLLFSDSLGVISPLYSPLLLFAFFFPLEKLGEETLDTLH